MTQNDRDLRLFIDGNLQFSSIDEYRYHEALVHPAMSLMHHHESILLLGGGDGLAVRELLKYPRVHRITLVDLDKAMTDLACTDRRITLLNRDSLKDSRVRIINEDAFKYLENDANFYDLILVDLPDPNNESLNKLYTKTFYEMIKRHLSPGGYTVIQSTSPFYASKVYWCIRKTLSSTGLYTNGYHLDVPAFGDWGFSMASNQPIDPERIHVAVPTRFIDTTQAKAMFVFGKDIRSGQVEINTITHPVIMDYYEKSWNYWQ